MRDVGSLPLDGLPVGVEDEVTAGVQLDAVVGSGIVHVEVHRLADPVLARPDAVGDLEVADAVRRREDVVVVLEVERDVVQLRRLLVAIHPDRDVVHLVRHRHPRRHERRRVVGHHDELAALEPHPLLEPPLGLVDRAGAGLDVEVVDAPRAQPATGRARGGEARAQLLGRGRLLDVVVELERVLAERGEEPDGGAAAELVPRRHLDDLDLGALELVLEELDVLRALCAEAVGVDARLVLTGEHERVVHELLVAAQVGDVVGLRDDLHPEQVAEEPQRLLQVGRAEVDAARVGDARPGVVRGPLGATEVGHVSSFGLSAAVRAGSARCQ